MPTRFRFASHRIAVWVALSVLFTAIFIPFTIDVGICAAVDQATARIVAENRVRRHIELFGDWNGNPSAQVGPGEAIVSQQRSVAYNFTVMPSGHVLVAADDSFNPVPLYSVESSFHPDRADHPNAIESWIVPEQRGKLERLTQRRSLTRNASADPNNLKVKQAWNYFTSRVTTTNERTLNASADTSSPAIERAATTIAVGPLIDTRWGQEYPYNALMPSDTGCNHTLTGCVATAWAQVLRYWQWPDQGINSLTYIWNGDELSADFSQSTYDWDNMPLTLTGASSSDQIQAVSGLIYNLAIASETDFGCTVSSSAIWANDVLDIYFKYKAMTFYSRTDPDSGDANYTAQEWFNLIKDDLDLGRPVILSIFTDYYGGHEVVVDGYGQDVDSGAYVVHINFGWPDQIDPDAEGYYGFYDISDSVSFDFVYPWNVNEQYIVTGIEPNYDETWPDVDAGSDQTADEYDTVTLHGVADDTAATYQWRCIDAPELTITGYDQLDATVRLPSVASDTQLVFRLKAIDSQGNVGYDDVAITVRDTGGDVSSGSSSDSGSGGGCFIESLLTYPHPAPHM